MVHTEICTSWVAGQIPIVCIVCNMNVFETMDAIQAQYKSYLYPAIYNCNGILPIKGIRGGQNILGIVLLDGGLEKVSPHKW